MMHPDTKLFWINDQIGYGVVATHPIPKGTITWTMCRLDIVKTPDQRAALPNIYQEILDKYCYIDSSKNTILIWDFGRYINHSCSPTTIPIGENINICIRDLHPGDELTYDYSLFTDTKAFRCYCGQSNCRGEVKTENPPLASHTCNTILPEYIVSARSVLQPLDHFLLNREEWDSFLNS